MPTGHTRPVIYAIRVQGRLEPRWSTWFAGLTLTPEADGTTVITGTVADQAALHGLLESLRDLGLPLLSVTQPQEAGLLDSTSATDSEPTPPTARTRTS